MWDTRASGVVATVAAAFLAVMIVGVGTAHAASPPDPPTNASITSQFAHRNCAGDADTLSWTAPANNGGSPITGYHIMQSGDAYDPPLIRSYDVGPNVTRLAVSPFVGPNSFLVAAKNTVGASGWAVITLSADGIPAPQQFGFSYDQDSVTKHSVAIAAAWSPQSNVPALGGNPSDSTGTITIVPGGQQVGYQATWPGGVAVTFKGLAWGTQYHFDVVVGNACGHGGPGATSPGFTTGVAPHFTSDTPPTTGAVGVPYTYRFHAGGDAPISYRFYEAPGWLQINSSTGRVVGTPPAGTTSFNYEVSAHNNVGNEALVGSYATTRSVVVTVR